MTDETVSEGIINRNGILWVHFRFKGIKCRESLQLKTTPKNIKVAERKRALILYEIEENTFEYKKHFPKSKRLLLFGAAPIKDILVKRQMQAWIEGHVNFIAHSTFCTYNKYINKHINPLLGERLLSSLTKNDLKWFVSELVNTGLSRKSISDILLPLRQMLEDAHDNQIISANPAIRLRLKNLRTNETAKATDIIDPFSLNEIRLILKALEGQVLNFFQFSLGTGMRTSELIELQWDDIDWQTNIVKVRRAKVMKEIKDTKTRAGTRDIPLYPLALEALKAQKQYTFLVGLNDQRYIFHDPNKHLPWVSDKAPRESHWRPVLRSVNVRYRYPYQCRHTLISHMLAWNEPITLIAELAGHNSAEMIFRRYARWIKGGPSETRYWMLTRDEILGHGHNVDTISL